MKSSEQSVDRESGWMGIRMMIMNNDDDDENKLISQIYDPNL